MKKLLLLFLMIPLVTGCTDINTTLKINPDKSADIIASLDYNGDIKDNSIPSQLINGVYKDFLDDTYTVTTESNENNSVLTATKKIKNISKEDIDLKSLGFYPAQGKDKFLTVKKNFWLTAYDFEAQYDYSYATSKIDKFNSEQKVKATETASSSTFIPEYYNKYADPEEVEIDKTEREDFLSNLDDSAKKLTQEDVADAKSEVKKETADKQVDATFSIKFPIPLMTTNADIIEGTTYIWKIQKNKPTIIKVQYIDYHGLAVLFIILLGIGFFVYVARRVYRHDSLKRIENDDVPKMHQ